MKKYLARVMAGVAFLNVVKPKWIKKIDLKKLDLQSYNTCVIGEVFGSYQDGRYEMGITDEQADALGFHDDSHSEKEYKKLTSVWKKVLKKLGAK